MGIYIKGLEMPKSCIECQMLEGDKDDGLCHAASRWLDDDEYWTWYVYPEGDMDDSKPVNCPLIPVPPHGDLIDRKAAYDSLLYGMVMTGYQSKALDCISEYYVPTIIPVEEDEI